MIKEDENESLASSDLSSKKDTLDKKEPVTEISPQTPVFFSRANTAHLINILNLENDLPTAPIEEASEFDEEETEEELNYKRLITCDQLINQLTSKHLIKELLADGFAKTEKRMEDSIAEDALKKV
jgi:hypothetical protein